MAAPDVLLDQLRELLGPVPPEERPRLLGRLLLEIPATTPTPELTALAPRDADTKLLKPVQAADVAQMSVRMLHRLTRGQEFHRRVGHRTIRYEEAGLQRWLRRRAGR